MPELPSGRKVAVSPAQLHELLVDAGHFGNIHKVMAIQSIDDVTPYIDILYLVPEEEAGDGYCDSKPREDSLPVPAGMVFVPSGYCLSHWETLAKEWSVEDRQAFIDFLSQRVTPILHECLDAVEHTQNRLRESNDFLTKVLVGWYEAGCHPAQEEGWANTDEDGPNWDDYDVLAALGQIRTKLLHQGLADGECPPLLALNAFWAICCQHFPPEFASWPDENRPVRRCADVARAQAWLDRFPADKRGWLHDQGIVECINLWETLSDSLQTACPGPYEVIRLVVVSAEANRFYSRANASRGGNAS